MKKFIMLMLGEGLLVVALLLLVVWFPFKDSTLYPANYSEIEFENLHVGDSKNIILKRLGIPLDVNLRDKEKHLTEGDYWLYTMPMAGGQSSAFYVRGFVFNRNGKVIAKNSYFEWD